MAKLDRAVAPMAGSAAAPPRWRDLAQTYGALLALALLTLYNVLFTRNFLSAQTFNVNLTQVATIVIVATGMTLVIATGGIDLSVGSLMAISGATAALFFRQAALTGSEPIVALVFVTPIVAAAAFGLLNGSLVAWLKLQPIIAQVVTGGNLQTFRNPAFQYIGMGRPLGIPFQVILMLALVALAAWVMRVTVFGRYVLAVGGNEAAARLAGVPVRRVKLAVYTISGVLSGIAGLIVIAINSSSDANQVGLNMELDAIAAVAVGGTPLTGGRATIVGTLIGALIMQLIRYTLLAHGVPDATALVVKAAIILVAVYVQRPRNR
jgi:simple sugar transport system permease protein/ribose transport system permease protein